MKSDLEIAQEASLDPISSIAADLGLLEDEVELYGKYKAKVSLDVLDRLKDKPSGVGVIPVTTMNLVLSRDGTARTCLQSSKPSTFGIIRSDRTTSGCARSISFAAIKSRDSSCARESSGCSNKFRSKSASRSRRVSISRGWPNPST